MKRIGLILHCEGLGDCLYAVPAIRKLHQTNGQTMEFDIFSHHPELFTHCPYIKKVYQIRDKVTLQTYSQFNKTIEMFINSGIHHSHIDTADLISMPLGGASLSFAEKQLEYFPHEKDTAGSYDVVLNTSQTWPTRTWPHESWQHLATTLLEQGYSVAVVGKDVSSTADQMLKTSRPLEGCVNLINQLSLDQTFYTIAKSKVFVSCQNGLSVLAATTDTTVVVLGMSIEWSKRAIYRHQDPHYKAFYIEGSCPLHCCEQSKCIRPDFSGKYLCQPEFMDVETQVLRVLQGDIPARRIPVTHS